MAKQTFTTGQVLTAAQMTSLQQTAMLGGAASAKTASYTLVAADAGTAITMSNASATTITVNTALFAAGDTVQITNLGAGVCTITAGTATVNTSASLALAQYESGTLDFTSTSAAIFIKGAGAAAASGGMTLLSTTSLTGAAVTVSSISGDYKDLEIVMRGVSHAVNGGYPTIEPNGQNNISDNYGGNSYSGTFTIQRSSEIRPTSARGTVAASTYNCVLTIYDYANTTTAKMVNFQTGYEDTGDTPDTNVVNGKARIKTNSAITSITFTAQSSNFDAGSVLIYGVK